MRSLSSPLIGLCLGIELTHQLPNIGKQFICLWDIFQSEPVVVEVIVDNSSIGACFFWLYAKEVRNRQTSPQTRYLQGTVPKL